MIDGVERDGWICGRDYDHQREIALERHTKIKGEKEKETQKWEMGKKPGKMRVHREKKRRGKIENLSSCAVPCLFEYSFENSKKEVKKEFKTSFLAFHF